jgi:DNA repair protein RecO (recombination protein O)
MIMTTDAIVLRTMRFRDTSSIATLYTRVGGKMSVIARGERERAAKHGGALDVLSFVNTVIYHKEQRDMQFLSKIDRCRSFRSLSESLEKMAAATMAVELVEAITPVEETNERLFDILLNTIESINGSVRNVFSIFFAFELVLLELTGFRPEFVKCLKCGNDTIRGEVPHRFSFLQESGGVLCGECAHAEEWTPGMSAGALRSLRALQGTHLPGEASAIALASGVKSEVAAVIRGLLHCHVEHLRPLKAEAVFASLLAEA